MCLFVCGDVRFPLNRIFFFMKAGGENKLRARQVHVACGTFVNNSYATNLKFVSVKNSGKNDNKYDIVCVCKHASRQTMF